MKRIIYRIGTRLKILALILFALILISWGMYGHEHINRAAVFALPSPLQTFFFNHIDFITQESTVPDLRKYTLDDKSERPRHYIDLENYGKLDSLPQSFAEAKKKFDEKFLQRNGILPWYIQDMMDKLTKAFKDKRKTQILFLAADLGHYIGDAHMPLHASANHDGQFTKQNGVHAFWESQLPELFGDKYNYFVGEAVYINDIQKETWRIIKESNSLADTLLLADKELTMQFPVDKIFLTDAQGKIAINKFDSPIYTLDYAQKYNQKLKGMVEKQMRLAILATASYWYTAWVNAGKPDLSDLDPVEQTARNKSNLKRELNFYKQGKLIDIKSEKEF